MKRHIFAAALFATLTACSVDEYQERPDRNSGPLAALDAAKYALHRRDYAGFYDALADRAVLSLLRNATSLCLSANGPEAPKMGMEPAPECLAVLARHEFPSDVADSVGIERFDRAFDAVVDKRAMAADIEATNRAAGVGSSFVWDHLDPIVVQSIDERGSHASAKVVWTGEKTRIAFIRDETGWRLDPFPDAD